MVSEYGSKLVEAFFSNKQINTLPSTDTLNLRKDEKHHPISLKDLRKLKTNSFSDSLFQKYLLASKTH
jgi:hypothetical protein